MISALLTRWVWLGQPTDPLVLNAPHHDGSTPSLARQVYHRLVVRLACVTVFRRQWLVLWFAFAVACGATSMLTLTFLLSLGSAILLVGNQLHEMLGLVTVWITLLATLAALPLLMIGSITNRVR